MGGNLWERIFCLHLAISEATFTKCVGIKEGIKPGCNAIYKGLSLLPAILRIRSIPIVTITASRIARLANFIFSENEIKKSHQEHGNNYGNPKIPVESYNYGKTHDQQQQKPKNEFRF